MFTVGDLHNFKFRRRSNNGNGLWQVTYKSEKGKCIWVCLVDNLDLILKTHKAGKNAKAKDIRELWEFVREYGTCYDQNGCEKQFLKQWGKPPKKFKF